MKQKLMKNDQGIPKTYCTILNSFCIGSSCHIFRNPEVTCSMGKVNKVSYKQKKIKSKKKQGRRK